jgi:hypothetical protein
VALTVVGIAVFVLALVLWAGGNPTGSGDTVGALPTDRPLPTLSESVYPQTPSASPSGSSSGGGKNSGITGLPPLPNLSAGNDVTEEQGRHQVTIRAASDTTILTFRYGIRGGKPATGEFHGIRSPVTVNSPARGNGVLAVVQVQASLYASEVQCAIFVDGALRSHNSAKGPHSVAVCVA